MNDPERLLHGSPDGLSARLLRAGADEAPARRSLERTLAALGAASTALGAAGTAGALGTAGTTKVATTLTLVSLAKWAGVGVASGVAVSLAAHVVAHAPEPHPQPRATVASSVEVRLAPPRAQAASEPPSPPPEPSVTPEPPSSAPVAAAMHAITERDSAPLAAEVTFVDRGRALFQRGNGAEALAALAGYEQAFPERRLLPEVLYLRMEALALAGERAPASDIARRIVRDYGKGPHAARARAVLANP
ncbi:MAG TPA: hypothetical protein VFV94_02385 [Polyangiaceae bacterium]|jgi:hypothetical protein|nr:hypothetical protein [Polyangiaceae bacterium]